MQLINRLSKRDSPRAGPRDGAVATDEHLERLIRESSIRTNRRHKFISCLESEEVSMGMFSPDDFRLSWLTE